MGEEALRRGDREPHRGERVAQRRRPRRGQRLGGGEGVAGEKLRLVEESQEPGAPVSLVARRHGVNPNQLFTWRRRAADGAFTAAAAGAAVVPASAWRARQEQIRELHRLVGKKTLEAADRRSARVRILREALQRADAEERWLLRGPPPPRDGSR